MSRHALRTELEPQGAALLSVEDLTVELRDGTNVISEVAFTLDGGEVLGIVGESGSGKTTVALSLLGYARHGSRITSGRVVVHGHDVLAARDEDLRALRGATVAYVPQDPSTSLNPSMRIGDQIRECLVEHGDPRARDEDHIRKYVSLVQLDASQDFLSRYPHQLSGGQQQRVCIAMALVGEPPLVVLDEPTTGLDVITRGRLLDDIRLLQKELSLTLVYVTHDLGVISRLASRVMVMYAGRVVEMSSARRVYQLPLHPYTQRLLAAVPRADVEGAPLVGIAGTAPAPGQRPQGCAFAPRCARRTDVCGLTSPLLEEREEPEAHLVACFHPGPGDVAQPLGGPIQRSRSMEGEKLAVHGVSIGYRQAKAMQVVVHDVSFGVGSGECLAIVGESGSGKSSIGRAIVGIRSPVAGTISLDGSKLEGRARDRDREQRRRIQIIFQNPDASLNPRTRIADIIGRPAASLLRVSRREARSLVHEAMLMVRLDPRLATRFPTELSGGEKQRVAIARALVVQPEVLVCDEITSALDVSIQAAIVELIGEIKEGGTAVIFISHDLGVVRSIADRIIVLEAGHIRESRETSGVFRSPSDSYTRALLDAERDWSLSDNA